MNITVLLHNIASIQADIEHHQLMAEAANRNQREQLNRLGEILRAGIDADNFPLRLQLNKHHDIRISDQIFKQYANLANCITVCRTDSVDLDTLMKLLEGIEE